MATVRLLALAAVLALLAGCQTASDPTGEAADRQTPRAADASPNSPSPTPTPTPDEPAGERFAHTFDEPVTWEDGGFSLTITELVVMDRERTLDENPMTTLDDSTSAVVGLKVSARNDSGKVAAWYPDQSQLVLGDEQVDAHIGFSGDVGHSEWQPGTERADIVVWELRSTFDDVVGAGEARYLVGAASDSEDWITDLSADADVTLTWPAP